MEIRWRFFHAGGWLWHKVTADGRIQSQSRTRFASLKECMLDAAGARYAVPLPGR